MNSGFEQIAQHTLPAPAENAFIAKPLPPGSIANGELTRAGFVAFETGSSRILPYGKANDYDVVVLFKEDLSSWLSDHDYEETPHKEGEHPNTSVVNCWRKDDINIIVVASEYSYQMWSLATDLAVVMNLVDKHQRVTLFQFFTEGEVREHKYINVARMDNKHGTLPSVRLRDGDKQSVQTEG